MYCPISYNRTKNQPVELSRITQSLIEWIDKLEGQFAKDDETGLINKVCRFSEMRKEIEKLERKGIKCKIKFRGNKSDVYAKDMMLLFFNALVATKLLLDNAWSLKNSNEFKSLNIEDVNTKLKGKDRTAKLLLGYQNEFLKRAGKRPSKKIESIFFENIENFYNILSEFFSGYNSDKNRRCIVRDLKSLCDEKFANYLENRRGTKDLLNTIENKLSGIYEEMLKKNKQLKSQGTDPKKFFENIKAAMKLTAKDAINYLELIGVLEKVRSYLLKFISMIINSYGDSKNQENVEKEQCIIEF